MLAAQMLGQVEPYQQSTEYNCAAATSHAVMKHWGFHVSEAQLARLIGVKPEVGATTTQIVDTARDLGFDAKQRRFRSVDELKALTDQDVPVIANVESFTRPPDGHFVVATDVNDDVELMDPNTPGNRRVLSRRAFDKRWHRRGRIGVVIRPRRRRRQRLGSPMHPPIYQQGWFWALTIASIGLGVGVAWEIFYARKQRQEGAVP
jgi:ABC-type bacteriocin/lantibiotic exporter with double-glycine peptidase domain